MPKSQGFADLHTHSIYTDGSYTPRQLVCLAKKSSLKALAITDHDNISAYHEAAETARRLKIRLLTGMEMSVNFRGGKLHILGLGFDINDKNFLASYRRLRLPKEACVADILHYLDSVGVKLKLRNLEPYQKNNITDRYTFFRYFNAKKIFPDPQMIWDHYLNPATKTIDVNLEAKDAILMIKKAGGITSLAHFHKSIGLKRFDDAGKDDCLRELKALGLDAVEAQYPDFNTHDREFIEYMADRHGFKRTGGTDFHGANRPRIELGSGIGGNVAVPAAWADSIVQSGS